MATPWRGKSGRTRRRSSGPRGVSTARTYPVGGTGESVWDRPARRHAAGERLYRLRVQLADWAMADGLLASRSSRTLTFQRLGSVYPSLHERPRVASRASLPARCGVTPGRACAARLFAADCAEHVLPIFYYAEFSDAAPREALRQAIGEIRRHADGETTKPQLTAEGEASAQAVMQGVEAALAREQERQPHGVPGRLVARRWRPSTWQPRCGPPRESGSPEAIATQTARHAVEAAANHAAALERGVERDLEVEGHAAAVEVEAERGPRQPQRLRRRAGRGAESGMEAGRIAERDGNAPASRTTPTGQRPRGARGRRRARGRSRE